MSHVFQIVATPIGNMGDISPRAQLALTEAEIVVAEDTRVVKRLMSLVNINTQNTLFISCPAARESERATQVIEMLEKGKRIAFVSDAGAPAVSDPGSTLVNAVSNAGYKVEVIPGPSAVIAALMGAGLIAHRYVFLGFVGKKGKKMREPLEKAAQTGFAVVLFESPYRIKKMLTQLNETFGQRRVVVARELTKKFETFHRGTLGDKLSPPIVEKGEMVVVIEHA